MLKASENKQTFILQNVWKQNIHKYIRVCVSCVVLSLAFAVTKGDNFSNATIVCSIWHILVCSKTANNYTRHAHDFNKLQVTKDTACRWPLFPNHKLFSVVRLWCKPRHCNRMTVFVCSNWLDNFW